jgi:hypothetical protein
LPSSASRLFDRALLIPPLMLAAALLLRALAFFPYVIDTDEGLYILQAHAWLNGRGWPLVAVWDMHPVGAPFLIAGAMALFGETIAAVRFLGMLAVAATGTGLWVITRALRLPGFVGVAAGLLYIGMTNRFSGLATNTEILFAPFAVAALAIALRAACAALNDGTPPRWRALVAMGLLVGVALTIKPVAMPEGCLAFTVLVLPAWRARVLPVARAAAMAPAYALLCLAPTALLAAIYAAIGALDLFVDAVFVAPFRYAGGGLYWQDATWLTAAAALFLVWPVLFALVAIGAAPNRRAATFGAAWFATATAAIILPGHFYNHYFLIWLAPLSLLASLGAWHLATRLFPARAALALAALAAVLVADSWADRTALRMNEGISIRFPDPVGQVGRALRNAIEPRATALVVNYHPLVYVLANATPPSRIAFPAQLTGPFDEVAGIDMDAEVARILDARPAAIVVDRGWWLHVRPTVRALVGKALDASYVLVAEVGEERGPVEIWGLR